MSITPVSDGLLRAIIETVRSGDFSHVLEYLAEDVQFGVSIAIRSPASVGINDRDSLIAHLQGRGGASTSKIDEAVDVFVRGERIVATRNAIVALGADTALTNECTLVCDVCDGLIRRLAVYHELSNAVEPGSKASAPAHRRNRTEALSVVDAVDA
jgi:hypothetical protein